MNSWVELSAERLAANYRALVEAARLSVLAVIKANGYGHGASLCAPVLARAGASWLGVTDVEEAATVLASLKDTEPRPGVLVMSGLLEEDADAIVAQNVAPVVWTIEHLQWLAAAAERRRRTAHLSVHLEIDTGMSRQGVAPGPELNRVLGWLAANPQIHLDGILTHFASAEIAGSLQTARQRQRFEESCQAVAQAGLRPGWLHASNTSVIDLTTEPDHHVWLTKLASALGARPMARSGLGLYGYHLPLRQERGHTKPASAKLQCKLKPVMTWKTRIIAVRDLATGESVGYNGIFTAERPMRIALLPVGYADGLRRELSATNTTPGGWVMINNQRAPIVGRISMNLTTVDISGFATKNIGDEAVLLGEGITADDHARLARTIPYEILCGVRAKARLT